MFDYEATQADELTIKVDDIRLKWTVRKNQDGMYAISMHTYVHTYVIIPYKFLNFTSLNAN